MELEDIFYYIVQVELQKDFILIMDMISIHKEFYYVNTRKCTGSASVTKPTIAKYYDAKAGFNNEKQRA